MKVTVKERAPDAVDCRTMRNGQIGEILDTSHQGKHLLKTQRSFVLLEDPSHTWTLEDGYTGPNFMVRVLSPGSIVSLELDS